MNNQYTKDAVENVDKNFKLAKLMLNLCFFGLGFFILSFFLGDMPLAVAMMTNYFLLPVLSSIGVYCIVSHIRKVKKLSPFIIYVLSGNVIFLISSWAIFIFMIVAIFTHH